MLEIILLGLLLLEPLCKLLVVLVMLGRLHIQFM